MTMPLQSGVRERMLINLPAPSVTSNNTEMVIFITNITGTSSGQAVKGNALENRVFWVSWNTQWQGSKRKTDPSSGGLQAGMMLYCNGGDSWASDFGWLSGMSVNTRLTHRTAHQIWFGRQLRDEAKTLSGPDVEKCFHLAPKFASVHERVQPQAGCDVTCNYHHFMSSHWPAALGARTRTSWRASRRRVPASPVGKI